MDRINSSGTIDIGQGRRGFRDENLEAGLQGTEVNAAFLNMIQEEILSVITRARITPDANVWSQLADAIAKLILEKAPDTATETRLGVVELATIEEATAGSNALLAVTPPGLKAAIDALINSAPGVLDTLNELAEALGRDPNFAATMAAKLALKANLSDLGSIGPYATFISDWNLAKTNGWYRGVNAANAPDSDWWLGHVEVHQDDWVTQTVHGFNRDDANNTRTFRRSRNENVWTEWHRLYQSEAELRTLAASVNAAGMVELATVDEAKAGIDGTRAVTPAGVKAVIDRVINGAPGALDALNELAAALGNDPNFANTIAGQIGQKFDKTGGNITGPTNFLNRAYETALYVAGTNPGLQLFWAGVMNKIIFVNDRGYFCVRNKDNHQDSHMLADDGNLWLKNRGWIGEWLITRAEHNNDISWRTRTDRIRCTSRSWQDATYEADFGGFVVQAVDVDNGGRGRQLVGALQILVNGNWVGLSNE
ncbi:hypothetical protein IFT84_10385 [Rhizobium sp. CFBP 8762]|uniref:pyocin knob domain-containing protein n=1 Tax=Rhizobium sp. CFBP 8762 TaxID=2775279 RepID=UPI0017877028|nr:pyocin knob domain-containing protein [Rhizobium sp. CFBP 8762]MBD8554931.1 hypothetical protein [Rhizobium sp. CFBP 8762]